MRGLRQAAGLARRGTLDGLGRWVWAQAPNEVCFVLDDVHEITAGSPGAELLGQLAIELPVNGHLLLASREASVVPMARLAASGQLIRVTESDLMFDSVELAAFAGARGVDPRVCAGSGGWPALAELSASAGEDMVLEYLWEEVLARLGTVRAVDLAAFEAVGGGDDDVARAVTTGRASVSDLVAGMPLVERTADGGAALHPLWRPALRRVASGDVLDRARVAAAAAHREAGRIGAAIDLAIEAEAWSDALALLRQAELAQQPSMGATEFGRWHLALPSALRDEPVMVMAEGLERLGTHPVSAQKLFERARHGFARQGDVEGEVAAIAADGFVRWWANDQLGMFDLLRRVEELAAFGSSRADGLLRIGAAAIAHAGGDSAGVLAALDGTDATIDPHWRAHVAWLRSVAHRRAGDLDAAYDALDVPDIDTPIDDVVRQHDIVDGGRTGWPVASTRCRS
ncbi:MAG: hypothetical protein QM733_15305 [Ilumatobacteraceae bacterium]